jgi:hypothetical protein
MKDGFVEIISSPWWNEKWLFTNKKKKFNDMMYIKYQSESICKARAIAEGYSIFASIDIDEYIIPRNNETALIDDLVQWFQTTNRSVMHMDKFNFNSIPHILEPINLLTIEAYSIRMSIANKMNYYNNVSPKIALRLLNPPFFTNDTYEYLKYCCDFHGCNNMNNHRRCHVLLTSGIRWTLEGKHLPWIPPPAIYRKHYYIDYIIILYYTL